MSLAPAFEIGVWNAWILMVYTLVHTFLLSLIFRNAMKKRRASGNIPYTKVEKSSNILRQAILILTFIYSIFLPLQLGTSWFYAGLAVYLVGLITYTIVMVNWASSPPDEPVTRGIYRYSRHPQYLTQFLMFIGVGIASASWILLLLEIVTMILINIAVIPEEDFCLEKYGDTYREYMNRTPRWIGIPK